MQCSSHPFRSLDPTEFVICRNVLGYCTYLIGSGSLHLQPKISSFNPASSGLGISGSAHLIAPPLAAIKTEPSLSSPSTSCFHSCWLVIARFRPCISRVAPRAVLFFPGAGRSRRLLNPCEAEAGGRYQQPCEDAAEPRGESVGKRSGRAGCSRGSARALGVEGLRWL